MSLWNFKVKSGIFDGVGASTDTSIPQFIFYLCIPFQHYNARTTLSAIGKAVKGRTGA
jgi:hypothetical protein